MSSLQNHGGRRTMAGVLTASAALCVVTLSPSGAALAAPNGVGSDRTIIGGGTGGDVSGSQHEFADNPESLAKVALTREWQRMLEGQTSPADYRAAEARFRTEHVDVNSQRAEVDSSNSALSAESTLTGLSEDQTVTSQAVAAAVASKTLSLTHYAQSKNYYCGPATGAMLVKIADGAITSRYNGVSFTQAHFAGPAHMQTEANNVTAWSSGLFVHGVDRWRGENWYAQVDSPSASLMKSALTNSIGGNSMPLAADTVEFAGGAHYNGHPVNQKIGHWILAYGYTSSGANVKFADPSTSVWGGSATFSATTSTFTDNYLQSNGIAY